MDADRHQEIARCLFRESNDALFLFDPFTHRVIDLNPAAIRLTGFEKPIACTKSVWDLFSGDTTVGLEPLIEAYRNTGFYHSRDGFFLSRRKDDPIPVNISVSRIHTQPSPMGLVVVRDVTERKKAEEAVRESEARYRGLVETARVIFWSTDPHGRFTSLNPQFAAITGWPVSEWMGRSLVDLVTEDLKEDAHALIASAGRGDPTPEAIDLRVESKTGEAVVLEFLSVARFGEGESRGISGIARDVTALRHAAEAIRQTEALQAARHMAEMADRAKSEFLAHVSHEIRTPMTSILGFIDILLRDNSIHSLPRERLDDLRTIEQNGSHLLNLIDDILDISRIEAGKLLLAPSPCSPLQIVSEVVDTFQARAEAKGIALELVMRGPVPASITTDALRLRQILINLLGNAIKFTESGAVEVGVEVSGRESEAPLLTIDVSDSGPGMTPDEVGELFKPFSRPSRDSERQPGGTGLGLAISRRLAEMLGGSISVESTKNRGSRFRLTLPLGTREEGDWLDQVPRRSRAAIRGQPEHFWLFGAKVLLAEDNPDIQRVMSLQLERHGATVSAANNGMEALDLAQKASESGQAFDIVLMDMQMPVLDGYEATRQLRGRGFRGAIIALTAYAMTEDREECLRLGCNEHISKPVDWDRLFEVLAQQPRRIPD